MKTVKDHSEIRKEQLISTDTESKKQNSEDLKSEDNSKLKENIHAVLKSPWFDLAVTAVLFAAPIASRPMMASTGKIAPKVGKALKYSPKVINELTRIIDRVL